jgi:hypothetical protein
VYRHDAPKRSFRFRLLSKFFFEVEVLTGRCDKIIERYVRHNKQLEDYLARENIEFLRFSITERDGWS